MAYNPNNANGQATAANSAPVVRASDEIALNPATTSISVLNGDLLPATDVSMYRSFSVQITGTFSATYTFQGSNDNFTTVFSVPAVMLATGSQGQVTSSGTSNIIWNGPIGYRYFRIRVTAYTSGTVSAAVNLSQQPYNPFYNYVNILGGTAAITPPTSLSTGTITTSSTTVALNNNFAGGGFAQVYVWGTYAGVSFGITVSGDNGSNFFAVPVYDQTANAWIPAGATITPGTNASKVYIVPLSTNTNQIKILSSAYTSGTANVRATAGVGGASPSLLTQGSIRGSRGEQQTSISTTTETTIVTAGGAGVFRDVYGLMLTNTSATAVQVTIRDVTAAGTTKVFYVPGNDTRGLMLPESAAMKQGTANSAWTATLGTAVSTIEVTALYVANT